MREQLERNEEVRRLVARLRWLTPHELQQVQAEVNRLQANQFHFGKRSE